MRSDLTSVTQRTPHRDSTDSDNHISEVTGHRYCPKGLETCHNHTSIQKRVKVKTKLLQTNITHMHSTKTNGTHHCVKHDGLL